jgi:hypothetical protein
MDPLESVLAAALVGVLLYMGDRGMAYNVCAYFAMASGGKFTAEQAYRETHNPFLRASKLVPAFVLVVAGFIFAYRGGIHEEWQVAVIAAIALWYVAVVTVAALKAFYRTQFSEFNSR